MSALVEVRAMKHNLRQVIGRRWAVSGMAIATGAMLGSGRAVAQCALEFAPAINYQVSPRPSIVFTADFNADGIPDIVTAGAFGSQVVFFRGIGDGSFQSGVQSAHAATATFRAAAMADVNGDGRPDFAVLSGLTLLVVLGNGDGTFRSGSSVALSGFASSIAVADMNGDGKPDVVVGSAAAPNVSVFLNDGIGGFAPPINTTISAASGPIAIGDFNGDGRPDLAVARNGVGTVSVLLGTGSGLFGTAADFPSDGSASVAVGDFNGDGKLDIATGGGGYVDTLLGNGIGGFPTWIRTPAVVGSGSGLWLGDVDGDGRLDALVSGGAGVLVLLGCGNGAFQSSTQLNLAGSDASGTATGDFRGWGRTDVAVVRQGGLAVFLRNSGVGVVHQPMRVDAVAGLGTSFGVTAASNMPLSYRWRKDGIALSDGGRYSGANTPTLVLSTVGLADNGSSFDCLVANGCSAVRTNPAGLAVNRRCGADFDGVDGVTIQDLFEFVASWLAGCP